MTAVNFTTVQIHHAQTRTSIHTKGDTSKRMITSHSFAISFQNQSTALKTCFFNHRSWKVEGKGEDTPFEGRRKVLPFKDQKPSLVWTDHSGYSSIFDTGEAEDAHASMVHTDQRGNEQLYRRVCVEDKKLLRNTFPQNSSWNFSRDASARILSFLVTCI